MIGLLDDDEPIQDTYESWLERQPKDDQIQVLGAERHKRWRAGESLESFVDLDNASVIPLDQLRSIESFS
jgi:hypothetical protein